MEVLYHTDNNNNKNISRDARIFATKTARSIAEVQKNVNNMADVLVFLEVLGYDDSTAQKNGFENLKELSKHVYNFIDAFDNKQTNDVNLSELPVPGIKQRLAEILITMFPWLGALVLLYLTGVSLWMAWGLPADVTVAFVAGVFFGLILTEGLLQTFGRLFSFYYSQANFGEVKRNIKRIYTLSATLLTGATVSIYVVSIFAHIPYELATITTISIVTISLHRISYVVLYGLKKLNHIALSYAGAFAALLAVFFLLPNFVPNMTLRYFAGLASAFSVLTSFAIYHHYKILRQSSISIVAKDAPHFYSPPSINGKTITSRFGVQLWECLPYSVYGTLYFVILFADRIISWAFNPITVTAANGTLLPLSFNSVYHIGADLALLTILPAAILQYWITSPIYSLMHNRATNLRVAERQNIDIFLRHVYRKMITVSVAISVVMATALNLLAPTIMLHIGGSSVSTRILGLASAGAVFMTIFAGNSIFLIFLNRAKTLALLSIPPALVVIIGGVAIAQATGFENTILAYVAAAVLAATMSTIVTARTMANGSSRIFARFI
jgi:hypothetical protein